MKTTVMFVELIVVGVGALIALAIFALAIYHPNPLPDLPSHDGSLLALGLALSYALGAIVDKISYRLFRSREKSIRRLVFAQRQPKVCKDYEADECYRQARRCLYESNHPAMIDLHEYSRSKVRICRGWTVDSVLIAVAILGRNAMLDSWEDWSLVFLIGMILLGAISAFAWQITQEIDTRWLCDVQCKNLESSH